MRSYIFLFGSQPLLHRPIFRWHTHNTGSGPGTGIWVAKEIWPNLSSGIAIDQNKYFISVGQKIQQNTYSNIDIAWNQQDATIFIKNNNKRYDLIIIANILNELGPKEQLKLIESAYSLCDGVIIIVVPGTSFGLKNIENTAKNFAKSNSLLAPYINNKFVSSSKEWIHFTQRFKRPEFLRRIRQSLRSSTLMASDWEETKYAYVTLSTIKSESKIAGRLIGPVKKLKGRIEYPLLTEFNIKRSVTSKQNKSEYLIAKDLRWGQIIN